LAVVTTAEAATAETWARVLIGEAFLHPRQEQKLLCAMGFMRSEQTGQILSYAVVSMGQLPKGHVAPLGEVGVPVEIWNDVAFDKGQQ
jgi:hypothetical protein